MSSLVCLNLSVQQVLTFNKYLQSVSSSSMGHNTIQNSHKRPGSVRNHLEYNADKG